MFGFSSFAETPFATLPSSGTINYKTLIVQGSKTVMTGSLNGPIFNERTINTDDPTYIVTSGVTSTSTVFVNSFYYVLLTLLATTTNSLNRTALKIKILIANAITSIVNLTKQITTTLSTLSNIVINLFKQVKLTLIVLGNKYVMTGTLGSALYNQLTFNTDNPVYTTTTGITSTATVSVNSVYKRLLSIVVTSINSLSPGLIKLKLLVTNIVTSSSSLIKQIKTTLTILSSSIADVFKQVKTTLITYGSKYVMSGGLNGLIFNALTINDEAPPSYILTPGINSTATVSVKALYYRILSLVVTSLSTLNKARITFKTLVSNTVTSLATLIKQTKTTLYTSLVTNIDLSFVANRLQLLSVNITSTSTLVFGRFFTRALSILSTSISTVSNAKVKILVALVTSYSTLNKAYRKVLTVVVNSLSTITLVAVYFTGLLSKIYIYAEDRVRNLTIKKSRSITIDKSN